MSNQTVMRPKKVFNLAHRKSAQRYLNPVPGVSINTLMDYDNSAEQQQTTED